MNEFELTFNLNSFIDFRNFLSSHSPSFQPNGPLVPIGISDSGTTTVKGMIGINVVHKLVSLIKIGSRIADKKHKLALAHPKKPI
jgi:hypothetical protein